MTPASQLVTAGLEPIPDSVAGAVNIERGGVLMMDRSRRAVLRDVSVGAGLATAGVVLPLTTAQASTADRAAAGQVSGESLTAFVRDPRAGEISVFVGTEEVVLVDRELAAALARAVHRARSTTTLPS